MYAMIALLRALSSRKVAAMGLEKKA